jgi:TPR repeat protein
MKSLEHYLQKVAAIPAKPVLVSASIEADDFSTWWELSVVFAAPTDRSWDPRWVHLEDPFNGQALLHGHEVLGLRYYELLVAMPPDDVFYSGSGIIILQDANCAPSGDLDGVDRDRAEELTRTLAEALDIPSWIEPKVGGPITWWDALERRAAEAGDVTAQLNIAREYAQGKHFGTPADAAIWFRRAAEQGSAEGAWRLGDLYATGRGVEQNLAEARRWIWRAAEGGHGDAQFYVGAAHEMGDGVAKDGSEAARWYLRAAEQGHAGAQNNLGVLYAKGFGVPRDDVEAFRWYAKAADGGNMAGQYNLGLRYQYGLGVSRDLATAITWLERAAEGGSTWAQYKLGQAFETGEGVPRDLPQAAEWYRLAADRGHAAAAERFRQLRSR